MRYLFIKTLTGLLLTGIGMESAAGTFGDLAADFGKAYATGKTAHVIDIDNDSLLLKRDDGFYTSGLRYTQRYTMSDTARSTVFGWRIGQELYTASDINLPPAFVKPPDHPYAGWLYGGIFKETHHASGSYQKFGVDIGCLGPCAGGEWTQNNLHRLLNQPLPQGWSRQVKNEAGIVLYGNVAPVRWAPGSSIDVTPNLHGRFGNIFTDIGTGLTVRAGQLNLLPDQSTLHAYFRVDGRVVGYNATMQGGYFSKNNVHTVAPKRFVGEAEVGFVWNSAPYGVNIGIVRRGNEVRDLPSSFGAQNFARVQFSYIP
jgi:lipid A 3-O-deacylase